MAAASGNVTAVVEIVVAQSKLVPVIQGGSRSVGADDSFSLDATGSIDPDVDLNAMQPGLHSGIQLRYAWSCEKEDVGAADDSTTDAGSMKWWSSALWRPGRHST